MVIDMEIVPDLTKSNISKNQVEYIQKKQHEYKIDGQEEEGFRDIFYFHSI